MDIKLVAVDMDGTLLDSKKRLPPDFIPWVKSHPHIKTVIASGRQYQALARDLGEISGLLVFIAENGGDVFEKGEMIYCNIIADEDIAHYLDIADSIPQAVPVICGTNASYFRPTDNPVILKEIANYYDSRIFNTDLKSCAVHDKIVKMSFFFENHDAEKFYPLLLHQSERAEAVLSDERWIDVSNRETSKGAALAAVQKKYGILPSESMAFGDYLNDMSLYDVCEESYCMANGHPDMKAAAKYMTCSNDDDGVMKILRTLP